MSPGEPLSLSTSEDLDLLARLELHDRLLPAGLLPPVYAAPLRLRLHHRDVHAFDLDAEQLLDCLANLGLVRVGMDAKAVLAVVDEAVGLLGDDRSEQHFVRMQAQDALPCTASSASCVTSSERAHTAAATFSSLGAHTTTDSRLRNDLMTFRSSSVATTTSGASLPHDASSAVARFVDGSSNPEPSRTPNVPFDACVDSALRSAACRALRFTLTSKLRSPVGNAIPPPVQCGARVVPARARPVPF